MTDMVELALTLYDALQVRAPNLFLTRCPRTTSVFSATTIAIGRLAFRATKGTTFQEDPLTFSRNSLLWELHNQGFMIPVAAVVYETESKVFRKLGFSIVLSPVSDWVAAVFTRLAYLVTDDLQHQGTKESHLHTSSDDSVAITSAVQHSEWLQMCLPLGRSWSRAIAGRVRASSQLPPKTLALTACALVLCATGALDPEEIRPRDVSTVEWQASIVHETDLVSASIHEQGVPWCHIGQTSNLKPFVTCSLLAKVLLLDGEDVRLQIFAGARAIQKAWP